MRMAEKWPIIATEEVQFAGNLHVGLEKKAAGEKYAWPAAKKK